MIPVFGEPSNESLPERLLAAGADAPERAVEAPAIGLVDRALMQHWIEKGIVRELSAGQYYVDRERWNARNLRLIVIAVLVGVVLAVIGLVVALYGRSDTSV